MAIYRAGPLAGTISGPVGGVTFVNRSAAPSIRSRARTINRASAALYAARNRYLAVQRAWHLLPTPTRDQWQAAGITMLRPDRLGVRRTMSGYKLFLWVNLLYLTAGHAILTAPPELTTLEPLPAPPFSSLAFTGGGVISIVSDPFDPGGNSYRMVYGARSHDTHLPGHWPFWRFVHASQPIVGSQIITPQWHAALGVPFPGEYCAARVVNLVSGFLPSPTQELIDTAV
ncbi:hypothetical protein LCGC14_1019360 [marine sediment metagenome]|uniref:Uncharacterized protein n=1 Tax=marine sediment metagenome TaxID=412755 RepID=A0A0F9QG33_9ZZZZ